MGLFDSLKSSIGQFAEAESGALIGPALQAAGLGSLQSVVDQLNAAGLGQQVQAWAKGGNPPTLTADQLSAIVSSPQVQQLAQHFGVDPSLALNILAHHLPQAVAQATQSGEVTTTN
jgi:uncharacterized protein YidB (DUF937 family)